MRKLILALAVIAAPVLVMAQPPAGNANIGDYYGDKVESKNAVPLMELPKKLESTESVEGKFKGKVLDVCAKKGCWVRLAIDDSTTAFVKMKDYAFFVPMAAVGKTVVIEGTSKVKTVSVAEQKHYAEDAKKSKEEIDAITKPKKEYSIMAKGIVVVEK